MAPRAVTVVEAQAAVNRDEAAIVSGRLAV